MYVVGAVMDSVTTVAGMFAGLASLHAETRAVITPNDSITYRDIDQRSARCAARLTEAGTRKGTVVGLLAPNGVEWVCWWVACARIGATVVPINTFAKTAEVQRILTHCGAHVLVSVPEFGDSRYREELAAIIGPYLPDRDRLASQLPQLRRVIWTDEPASVSGERPDSRAVVETLGADVTPADPLTIIYSSGSTGDPKGIVHTHGSVLRQARRFARLTETNSSTVLWTPMPLNWVGGLVWSWLRTAVAGGTLVTQEKYNTESALEFISATQVDTVTAWPTMIENLRSSQVFSEERFGHIRGLGRDLLGVPDRPQTLGMSETLGPHSGWFGAPDATPPSESIGSWGRALPDVEHRIVDRQTGIPLGTNAVGELHVRGDSLMVGMNRRERSEVFTDDGWYPTGDRAELRPGGWLVFHGRLDDMIKTAGANVSPLEVQSVLEGHPEVKRAWVTGIDDAARGQIVAAVIVPAGSNVEVADVLAAARSQLASYKVPRRVHVLAEADIPWLSSQKVDMRTLRSMLGR
jgi:acyl-CoA synthetase (AMP-forming)/AMP-acid ligase II